MMDQTKTAAELAAEIKSDFEQKHDKVKEIAEKAIAEAQKGVDQSASAKEIADNALTAMNEAKVRLDELEQKMARGGGSDEDAQKSIGEQFTSSENFKAFADGGFGNGQRASLSIKATLTSATTDAAGSVGDAVRPTRLDGILPLAQRRLTVRDLLSQGRMDGSAIEYVKETGFTNSAAPVAEAAAKPESDMKLDLVTTSAKVIAHWMKASRQILSDVSQLQSVIDQRLRYGLAYVEEQQLLNGSGTGQNLHGIIPQATAYSAPITLSSPTSIDLIRLMALQAALAEYPSTGIVMHPADWAWIETLKDGEGRYIIGNPQGSINPTLWSLPVVATQAMTIDKVLVGAFRLGAQVFDRWDARVETGYVNDDFTKNLVTILAEERLALAVYRPEAFIFGDFGRSA
ncbi:phage major capsid protein [Brevundimonas balnearis]|uniref:Phage major capsid protein n=1 Tax=Brevundimonas balnearis TaxID=1572858 RepID=A0ABV6R0Y9_9CAUL